MQEALARVRADLGPDAAVLHTREVRGQRWMAWLTGSKEIEVTASAGVNVPSRLPRRDPPPAATIPSPVGGPGDRWNTPPASPAALAGQLQQLQAMVHQLCERSDSAPRRDLPDGLFRLYTELIDAEFQEDLARQLVEEVRAADTANLDDPAMLRARIGRLVESSIRVTGPLRVEQGKRRLVALVGPTGVGKTTTIAKLAANYRLKEKRRVGLITVDTYRIAAVEQLRTYAEIIDLPMQVVSSPREMHDAVRRMENLELLLMDTAGRSPKDDVKIRELRAFLTEAGAAEIHLVLSSVANPRTMQQTAERFAAVGTTSLILTKLDEGSGLGNLLPLLRHCQLPLSYLTHGQNVPDDIEVANPHRLARRMLTPPASSPEMIDP